MRSTFLPFTRPSITEAEVAEVADALRSGWITTGPRVAELQRAFAEHVGVPHALAVTSATAGFHILFEAMGLGPGDEVITSSLTWPSPINMVERTGARPVFADVDRRTLQLDPASVEAAVTSRTRVILPVHFAGQPCDVDRLHEIARPRGIVIVDDAAHAVGTEYKGRRIGSSGNPAVYSFHAIKNLTTGEGGMVTTSDGALKGRLASLRFHGVDQDAWKRYAGEAKVGYDCLEPGWKYNLTDIQAALGLVQLRRIGELQSKREALARRYDELLDAIPQIERPARVAYPAKHSWHLYQIIVDRARAGLSRDELRDELKKRNIGTGLHFLAVHQLKYYRERYPQYQGRLRATEEVSDRILSLPFFPDMTDGDLTDVVDALRSSLK